MSVVCRIPGDVKILRLIALAVWTGIVITAQTAGAQSVAIEPAALSRVPLGNAGGGIYWQQLKVTLAHPDQPSSESIRIGLPSSLVLHDADGDGALFDEVRVVYRAVDTELPRYEASTSTTESTIVLSSRAAATAGGQVYVQFPCRSAVTASATSAKYGSIEFADSREVNITQDSPVITFVDEGELAAAGSMGIIDLAAPLSGATDTLTSARGTVYPETSTTLVLSLPDLVFDGGQAHPNRRAGLGDGDDANDTPYRFYFATEPNLTDVGPSVATPAIIVSGEAVYGETEGTGSSVQLLTRDLPAGTYWLYVVSTVTGRTPLGRSRAIVVRHQPVIERLGPVTGDSLATDAIVFDSGGLLNEAGLANGKGPRRLVLDLQIVDHDDSARTHLFYSADPNLGPSNITRDGARATLSGATAITTVDGVSEETRRFDWRTVSPVVEEGDYYVYAVAVGGTQASVDRSSHQILVRHSPFLHLDDVDGVMGGQTIVTGGVRSQRFLTIGWGQGGIDGDVDADNEASISLYLSPDPEIAVPNGADAIEQDPSAHLIVSGLSEQEDDRASNQFVWDLWSLERGPFVPIAMQDYYVYGLIEDGSLRRLTRMGDGPMPTALRFEHPPTLLPMQPSAALTVGAGESARISWQDMDLDDNARLRIILSAEDHGDSTSYSTIVSGQAYVVNSTDGFAPSAVDPMTDLSEDDDADVFDLTTGHLQRGPNTSGAPQAGTYHVYLAITDSEEFDSGARAWRTPGTLTLGGPSTIPARRVFNLLPENFTIGIGSPPQQVDVVVDALEQSVDLILITLRLDATIFDVVDQDTTREGVQPFFVRPGFQSSKLVTNQATVEDGSLLLKCEYFDPGPDGIPSLLGDRAVIAMEILAIAGDGSSDLQLLSDADNGLTSQLERDGEVVAPSNAEPLATARLVPGRATVNGLLGLEGRTDRTASIDVAWRHWGAFVDIDDSLFAVSNDTDPDRDGVQVPLQPDGSFQLSQAPTGLLDLHVRLDGYLEGRIAGLELHPGSTLDGVRPSTVAGDTLLLGGDVAGYLSAEGTSLPDNEVTLADWDYVASLFDRQLASDADSIRADITGDGRVGIRDLTLVGANYLNRGPIPVYRPAGNDREIVVKLGFEERAYSAGDTLSAILQTSAWTNLRALEIALAYDDTEWELIGVAGNQQTLMAERIDASGGRWGVTRIGQGDVGPDPVRWTLVARRDRPALPRIRDILLIGSAYQALDANVGPVTAVGSRTVGPVVFNLRPNYPNPFNPATTIYFDVGGGTGDEVRVELDIYDALGQRLVRLVDEAMTAGRYTLMWDGRNRHGQRVSSGVYYARLRAGSFVQTRPMLLLK